MGTPCSASWDCGPNGLPGKNGAACGWTRAIAGLRKNAGRGIDEVGEVYKAVDARQDDAHGSESRPDDEVLQIVYVHAEFGDVVSFYPGDVIGKLDAAFVDGIENAEVMSEKKSVGDVEVGLSGGAGEIVVTAGPLDENAVDKIGREIRVRSADERLVTQENVVTAAGSADAAAVESAADELIEIAGILNRVADGETIILIEFVIDFDDAVVVVFGLENVQILGRDSQSFFGLVDQGQVGGGRAVEQGDGLEQRGGICGGFPAALAFIVGEEEGFVFLDGAADGGAELILAQGIGLRSDLQERAGIGGAVLEIVVERAVEIVAAGFGDDVDDAAEGAAVFGAEAVVDYAEFAYGFLRRSGTLRACGGVDVVGAVDGDFIAKSRMPAKETRVTSNSVMVDCRLVRPVATPGVSRAKSVKRRPLMGRESICLVSITWLTSVREGSITGASPVTTTCSPLVATLRTTSTVALWPTVRTKPVCV